jgi:aryl-alcohol dehydrogenase-like predicted oxidoreductase
MGRLTGKYSKDNPPPSGRHFSNVDMTEIEPLIENMRRIGNAHNVSVSSVALNYVMCKGNAVRTSVPFSNNCCLVALGVIPLPGARDAKQAEQNAGAFGWRLTEEEIKELESHQSNPKLSLFNRFWQRG